jgi:flagellar biosynthetic protein FlhB
LAFNIERIINPINGLKRMFSIKALAELVKSIVKIIVVSLVAYQYIKGQINEILNVMDMETANMLSYFAVLVFNVGIRISVTFIILGIIDYLFQWWQYEKDLRMSKQEIKDEYKETEGNPQIKSKIREKQRAISMRRMMQEVPKADVVITNPTHFAVAIKYDLNVSSAPIVIAKGQDFIAQRIKEIARENKVEIVENKPLARTLYSTVEIGESIPQDLFQAVAEVLAFVYSLKEGKR